MKRVIKSSDDFIVNVDIPQGEAAKADAKRFAQMELNDEASAEDERDRLRSQFQLGYYYKLYRKDGSDAVRTFRVINLSQKNKAIKVKGGINGIFKIKDSNKGDEQILLLGMGDRNYLSPSSKDIIIEEG